MSMEKFSKIFNQKLIKINNNFMETSTEVQGLETTNNNSSKTYDLI